MINAITNREASRAAIFVSAPQAPRSSSTPERPASLFQTIGFFLFVLVNATLFLRPAEIAPELEALPTYEILIILCLFFSLPAVLKQLSPRALRDRPVTLVVLAVMPAVVLSQLFSPYHYWFIWGARMSAYKFFKILVYYLIMVALLDTPAKLIRFIRWLGVFILVLTALALLQWHEVIQLPAIADAIVLEQTEINEETGEATITLRLQSTGSFNDPNDLCLILVVGMAISLWGAGQPRAGLMRLARLAFLAVFVYALYLTKSRGGFIAMLAGMLILFYAQLGWFKTLLLSMLVLPVIFLLFAGRATEISSSSATAQSRLQLWSQALDFFREAPAFGIGEGEYQEYSEDHLVAHNSFLHAYAELGFFGGSIFLGAFYYSLWLLLRLGARPIFILNPDLRRLRPFLATIVGGYAAGLLSLSRIMITPTYMILGLAATYLQMATSFPPLANTRFNFRSVVRLALVGMAFLILSYLYVRSNVRWS
jgi:hypothetical protein